MIINLKNKDTLIIDEFKFKCCIGKNGITDAKIEGDKYTPKGKFKLGLLYYRADRVKKPSTNLKIKKIKKNMGWCNDQNSKYYNKEIKINKKYKYEKLYREDYKYNYLIVIEYNMKRIIPNKGSAIFLHLTKNYKPTVGCIGLKEKDFLILLKIINKKTRISIS
ncbi:MAG: transpeptidase [Candidatus Pelagibacter sp.]|nr:transpeptidase [Candidatus Pelagibacter sp.]|tara:strand:- start:53 stop:544 length:492 start_codon:yes stop_codon:yes gene_type:complete